MTYGELQKSLYTATASEVERAAKALEKVWAEASRTTREALRQLYQKLQGLPESELYNGAIKFKRLSNLLAVVEAEHRKAWAATGRTVQNMGRLAMSNQFYRDQYAILLGAADSMRTTFALLDPSIVELSVIGLPSQWENLSASDRARFTKQYGNIRQYQPKYGTLLDVLARNEADTLRRVNGAITNGLIQGQGYQETARDVRRGMQTSYQNALRIARTESHRLQNAGANAASNWAKDQGAEIVRLWQATLDDRTRDSHAQLDGVPENKDGGWVIDGEFAPYPGAFASASQSISCRCTTVDQVQGLQPQARRARNPITGETEVIQAQNFQTWAKSVGLTKNRFGQYYK